MTGLRPQAKSSDICAEGGRVAPSRLWYVNATNNNARNSGIQGQPRSKECSLGSLPQQGEIDHEENSLCILAALFVFPHAARAQFLVVDCSGLNPFAFPTINSALPLVAGPGAFRGNRSLSTPTTAVPDISVWKELHSAYSAAFSG